MKSIKSRLIRVLEFLLALSLALAVSGASVFAAADAYPSKHVRLIIAFAPGGATDIVGRAVAAKLSERLGQRLVPDNRGGAGGILAMEMVAQSEADGYTLLFTSPAIATNPSLYRVPYDPVKSFAPIAKLGNGPVVLAVHPSVPADSLKELIALAKKQPGKLVCASTGVGGFIHLAGEHFRMMADIDFKTVQFKSGGQAMTDVMGGHSQIVFGTMVVTLPHIKSGKLKALGFSGRVRSKLLPDVPTISEAGVPGYEASTWWGILAPAGTPKAIVDKLHKELVAIMNSEDMKKMFEAQGSEADLRDPAEFGKFIEVETAKWAKVVKEGNIKAEELK